MADLLTKLKQYRPAVVVAYDQDDEQIRINVPDVRKKHERVLKALDDIAWVRVDMLDKKGGHLHRHVRSVDDTAPQDLEQLVEGRQGQVSAQLAPLVQIMLRAQEVAVSRHQQGMQQLLDATHKMIEAFSRRLDLQEKQYEHAQQLNHSLTLDLMQAQMAQLAPPEESEEPQRPHSDAVIGALMPRMMAAMLSPGDKRPQKQQPRNGDARKRSTSAPAADAPEAG